MKLLSLLISLVMLLSGGYMAEDPNAAAAAQITIRDLVVEIQDEEYALNPSISFGAATENGAALLDLYMALNDQILFPIQAKIDETGAGVLLGNSDTAYTFTPEFFNAIIEEIDIPDEALSIFDDYTGLTNSMTNLVSNNAAANQFDFDKLLELAGDVECTEATFYADGSEQTGQHFAFELDSDAMTELMEYSFTQMPAEYSEAYFGYINTLLAMAGEPEVSSITELMDFSGVDMSISGEATYNDTSAVLDCVYHILVDESAYYLGMGYTEEDIADMAAEPIQLDLFMNMTIHNAENMDYVITSEIEGVTIGANTVITNGTDMYMNITVSDPEVVLDLTFDMSFDGNELAFFSTNMFIESYGIIFNFSATTTPTDAVTTTDVMLSYIEDEVFSASASFSIDATHNAIADRVSAANIQTISSVEDEAINDLSLAAMSMMSDVETLLNDESVIALVEVIEQLFGYAEMDTEVYPDKGTVSAEPTFAEPTFEWMPEGYSMVDYYFDGDFGCYSYTFEHIDDTDSEYTLYVDVYDYGDEGGSYYMISDGEATALDAPILSATSMVEDDFASHNIWGNYQGHYVNLYSFDPALTTDDLANIVAHMVFAE